MREDFAVNKGVLGEQISFDYVSVKIGMGVVVNNLRGKVVYVKVVIRRRASTAQIALQQGAASREARANANNIFISNSFPGSLISFSCRFLNVAVDCSKVLHLCNTFVKKQVLTQFTAHL
jgi:hypothetical protein